ncbi:hypothetical protein ZWY2020_050954 [Hordeum vulgare]|nr:hypothetical protein ZWY2020_050954 [Hordeum vulgare]
MAEEPFAKRQCGETSKENTKVDDVQVPDQKLDYTKCLNDTDIHGKEKMDVVCTSNPDVADEMINMMKKEICVLIPWYIGVDVEYTREDEPPQRVVVLQLCVEELCLVYHITAATKRPKGLRPLLQEEKLYTFVSFSIEGDKRMLKESSLEINPNKYIGMQHKCRVHSWEERCPTLWLMLQAA